VGWCTLYKGLSMKGINSHVQNVMFWCCHHSCNSKSIIRYCTEVNVDGTLYAVYCSRQHCTGLVVPSLVWIALFITTWTWTQCRQELMTDIIQTWNSSMQTAVPFSTIFLFVLEVILSVPPVSDANVSVILTGHTFMHCMPICSGEPGSLKTTIPVRVD